MTTEIDINADGRRIVVIKPDGTETVLDHWPTFKEIQEHVGGYVERVRVLRQDIVDRNDYTVMMVNEDGLPHGLPRNQKATDIYLANVRRQFPNAENPSKAAREAWLNQYRERGIDIEVMTTTGTPGGYEDDPYIAGTVVWFDRWTEEELTRLGM